MITEDLKKKIKIKMIEEDLTVGSLANKYKVSRTYMSYILNGKQENLLLETKILRDLDIDDTRTIIR